MVLLPACGGAPSPEAARPEDAAEPASVDAAGDADREEDPEDAFARAEQELVEAFGEGADPGQPGILPRDATNEQADRCTVACKALSSMQRSADRVCGMTGEGDARCESLRERVERARSRVHESCPACVAARL